MPEITAGTWTLDPRASSIGFSANAFLGIKVKSSFSHWEVTLQVGGSAAESSVAVTVWTDSLATGLKLRDGHLRSSTAFASTDFPTLEFHSTAIAETADGLDVTGSLRIRDVTKTISFHAVRADTPGEPRFTTRLKVAGRDYGFTRSGTTRPADVLIDASLVPA